MNFEGSENYGAGNNSTFVKVVSWIIIPMLLALMSFYGFVRNAGATVCYTASGWAQTGTNGTLKSNGQTSNGLDVFTIDGQNTSSGVILFYDGGTTWEYDHTTNGQLSGADLGWWYNTNVSPTLSWVNNSGGTIGTITVTSCDSPTPTPSSDAGSATSTVDQVQQNFFGGVIIFFIGLATILWITKRQ
jgi:hypothetical protein